MGFKKCQSEIINLGEKWNGKGKNYCAWYRDNWNPGYGWDFTIRRDRWEWENPDGYSHEAAA